MPEPVLAHRDSDGTADRSETPHVRVAIVGTGFAGLGAAIRLKREGIHDFVLLERAADLGGTWRDNHYPGLCCDVPSHVYSYSFELNPGWTRGFAPGGEIQDYLRGVADKHGLHPHIRFGQEVLEAAWDDELGRWEIETAGGRFSADVLITATGGLSEPHVPPIPGLDRFRGARFHSADWDHEYDLNGKRVAVIGTGASAIQFVPRIQSRVAMLHLFQRTPPWVMPRLDHRITRAEHTLLRRIPFLPRIVRSILYWLIEVRFVFFRHPRLMRLGHRIARRHLERQIPDPELRRRLTPDYVMGCKRVLISDDYYPSLIQPNVEVVTDGIREVRERSILLADGSEREVDAIILGTGFHVTDMPIAHRIRRGGTSLAEAWAEGMRAYLGTTVAGFPNLFMLSGPNTGLGHNSIVFMIESQLNYVLDGLRALQRHGARRFEVRAEAQQRFNEKLQRQMRGTVWTSGHCNSWYLDEHGRNTTLWPRSTVAFRRLTRRFDPEAYVFDDSREPGAARTTPASAPVPEPAADVPEPADVEAAATR